MMQRPAARDFAAPALLDAWDAGQHATPMQRARLLLREVHPEEAIESWPIGQVNAALLAMRQRQFGNDWPCLVDCPNCGEVNELALQLEELLEGAAAARSDPGPREGHVDVDGWAVDFRMPCLVDLLEVGRTGGDARDLLRRIASAATHAGTAVATCDIPDAAMLAIGAGIEAADPLASIELALACPACALAWSEPLHVIDVLWSELSAYATRLLSEVGRLAQGFGWSEGEILAMSAQRRQRYLAWLAT